MENREIYQIMKHQEENPNLIILNTIDTFDAKSILFTQKNNANFNYGCVYREDSTNTWRYKWEFPGKVFKKSFSISYYGEEEAKKKAEEYRYIVYPTLKDNEDNTDSEQMTKEEIETEKKRMEELVKSEKYKQFGNFYEIKYERKDRGDEYYMKFEVQIEKKKCWKQVSLKKYSKDKVMEILNEYKKELFIKQYGDIDDDNDDNDNNTNAIESYNYDKFGGISEDGNNLRFGVTIDGKRYTKKLSVNKFGREEALKILNDYKKEMYDKYMSK